MKQYSHFTAVLLSFFSPGLYRDVGGRWKAIGFAYLGLLSFLSTLLCLLLIYFAIQNFTQAVSATQKWTNLLDPFYDFIEQVPDFSISDGTLELGDSVETPHVMHLDLDGEDGPIPIIAFDPNATLETFLNSESPIIINDNSIMIRKEEKGSVETHFFSENEEYLDDDHIELDAQSARSYFEQALEWVGENGKLLYIYFASIYGIFGMIGAFILMLIYAIVIGMYGVMLGFVTRVPVTFGISLRLACVTLTPLVFINIMMIFFNNQGLSALEQIGIITLYMVFALRSCRNIEFAR